MSWDYEKTLPNRPHSLAWEVRKTNVQPRVRNKNITSPASLSGKSSPSYSGNTTPCPTISKNKLTMSPNKTKPPVRTKKLEAPTIEISDPAAELMAIKEKQFEQLLKDSIPIEPEVTQKHKSMSLENVHEATDNCSADFGYFNRTDKNTPEIIVIPKTDSFTITEGIHDDNLTLLEYLTKYSTFETNTENHKDQNNQTIAEKSDVNLITAPLKLITDENKHKSIMKLPPKANYSLRNQTIRNSKAAPENLIKKSASIVLVSNRCKPANIIRSYNNPSNQNIIPPTRATTNAVLINRNENCNNQKYQHNLSVIRSKTMIEMPNKNIRRPILIKAGELLKKNSKENTDSSTSTLKASTNSLIDGGDGFKKVCSKKSEKKLGSGVACDGEWVTVKKTKRRSSWTSRFDQPSASASLPSLSLLNENADDSNSDENPKEMLAIKSPKSSGESSNSPKSCDKNVKVKVQEKKSLKPKTVTIMKAPKIEGILKQKAVVLTTLNGGKNQSQNIIKPKTASNVTAINARKIVFEKLKNVLTSSKQNCQDNIQANGFLPKRQKSDLTGLKIKSLRKEYLRSEKFHSMDPTKHQKSMTAANNEKNSQDASNSVDKVDMNVQTTLISPTIDELYSELKEKSEDKYSINGDLSSCEESDDTDDDQKKLLEEQESLERQIRELENTELDDIDLDTETDETDCEAMLCDLEYGSENNDPAERNMFIDDSNPDLTLEMRYAPMLSDLTSAERAETLATLQELVARDPGRAQKLHQKLSSPSRRRSFHETLKKYQAKQSRAQEKRFALRQKNAQKIQLLIQRVEQVKAAKSQLIENKRLRMEERLQRAAENREVFLKNKVRKAHDEEEKLKEIAFIKSLEAQNKRLELLESNKDTDMRLADIEQERQKRAEEKAAKEAAVERRRLELEMERKKKLEKMDETR